LAVSGIKFEAQKKGGLILGVDKTAVDASKLKEIAEARGLGEKDEIHLTVIGSDTMEAILASLGRISDNKRNEILSQIQGLAESTEWKFKIKPEFYYVKKEYNDPDPNNHEKTIPETRRSIVQMVETENLGQFYGKLEEITGLKFEVPLLHITLFTTSTREDKKQRGIGIYSEKDFESLNPERIEVN